MADILPPRETFTRAEVIHIMEQMPLYNYNYSTKKWNLGGHMAASIIKESTDKVLHRMEFGLDSAKQYGNPPYDKK
jgi:hypothetical protein